MVAAIITVLLAVLLQQYYCFFYYVKYPPKKTKIVLFYCCKFLFKYKIISIFQFYLDRMQSLIQCKHLHMLRWQRFCEHTDTIERIYPTYRKRLDDIQSEYEDAKIRARRLSAAHHSFVLGNKKAIDWYVRFRFE